jgi:hypothetical protein
MMSKSTRTERGRGRPSTGNAQTAAQRMRRYRARQRAAGLRMVTRPEALVRVLSGGALRHRIIEARSLAMHCLVAQKIELKPTLLKQVKKTLETWRQITRDLYRNFGRVCASATELGFHVSPPRPIRAVPVSHIEYRVVVGIVEPAA